MMMMMKACLYSTMELVFPVRRISLSGCCPSRTAVEHTELTLCTTQHSAVCVCVCVCKATDDGEMEYRYTSRRVCDTVYTLYNCVRLRLI